MIDTTELAAGLVVAMILEMRVALARVQHRIRANDVRDKNVLNRVSTLELRLRPLTDRIRKVVAQQAAKRALLFVLVLLPTLFAASCSESRGSLPGHNGGSSGYGVSLAGTLVWLDSVCILCAGLCAALAFFGAVPNFTKLMWAGAAGFLTSLCVSLFVGAIIPALPWIVGGLVVVGGAILLVYLRKHGPALWARVESSEKTAFASITAQGV